MAMIVRRNPFREMVEMQRAFDRALDEARSSEAFNALALDVRESEDAYTVETSLPGLTEDEIEINLHENTLTINAEFNREVNEGEKFIHRERSYGKFRRTVNLPQMVDSQAVTANYENGVLTLTLPKAAEARPRRIPVTNGQLLKS